MVGADRHEFDEMGTALHDAVTPRRRFVDPPLVGDPAERFADSTFDICESVSLVCCVCLVSTLPVEFYLEIAQRGIPDADMMGALDVLFTAVEITNDTGGATYINVSELDLNADEASFAVGVVPSRWCLDRGGVLCHGLIFCSHSAVANKSSCTFNRRPLVKEEKSDPGE